MKAKLNLRDLPARTHVHLFQTSNALPSGLLQQDPRGIVIELLPYMWQSELYLKRQPRLDDSLRGKKD